MIFDTKFEVGDKVYLVSRRSPGTKTCGLCDGKGTVAIVGVEDRHLCPQCRGQRSVTLPDEWVATGPCEIATIGFKAYRTGTSLGKGMIPTSVLWAEVVFEREELTIDMNRVFTYRAEAQKVCEIWNKRPDGTRGAEAL